MPDTANKPAENPPSPGRPVSSEFLSEFSLRKVAPPSGCPFAILGLAIGKGASPLEVLAAASVTEPALPQVRSVWKARQGGRAAPLLLVVLNGEKAALCGPSGDEPPTYSGVEIGQAERICREALEQPDRHAALRWLRDALPSMDSRLPGLRNEGFLATHELAVGARHLDAWNDAQHKARPLLQNQGDLLLRSLGFQIEAVDQVTAILRTGGKARKVAVAVLLRQDESPELSTPRFTGMSPVSYALAVADRENIPYVLISQGSKLRLYPAKVGVGVGRRGRTETYVEIHTGLLRDSDAAFLWLLFSAEALSEGGSLTALLDESNRFAGDLAERLRERIYVEVIPRLAQGLAAARGLRKPTAQDLAETYEMAMMVLFRLLFIAYAEDKDLLPYKHNGLYRSRSLKEKARELLELARQQTPFDRSTSLWEEVSLLCRAVDEGKAEWGVPAYDGGLFSRDREVSPLGALLDKLTLPNTIFGHALHGLLVIQSPEGWGPVDFRSLNVGEFGTIYQGLLENELAVAETNLTVDKEGFYRPCRAGEEPLVRESHIYLHNRSGARKATGTYFTRDFAVAHLLDQALEPALATHCRRLDGLDDGSAAEAFFDFRVADISMGSAHFLVGSVDRIERAFTGYVAKRPLPGVRNELLKLRAAAEQSLGPLAETVEIEDTQLLRRLIARRCIYGVDLNPVAVDLARLSLWIHTFVPGLPLSLLDRNLIVGNSLVGIGQLSEIEDKAREADLPLFTLDAVKIIGDATEPLKRLARLADASTSEIASARKAMEEARKAAEPAQALCDIVAAVRLSGGRLEVDLPHWESVKATIVGSRQHRDAEKTLAGLNVLHFPVAFPEVFLRQRKGFDVIVGNPPWEEATVEEHAFWARHSPGLRAVSQREREAMIARLQRQRPDLAELYKKELAEAEATRKALVSGPYPGMGTGDPDLYKAFCWRFLSLVAREGGWIAVVLPRSAFNAKGSTDFRKAVFETSNPLDVTMLVNNRQWIFPEVHPQYTVGLVASCRGAASGDSVRLRGPFRSLERFRSGASLPPAEFPAAEVIGWTDSASLPLLPTEESLEIFTQLRKAPRLDLNDGRSWRARPHAELHATNDKPLMDLKSTEKPRDFWPVFKGESFDTWQPDTGRYYAWADPKAMLPELQGGRIRGGGNRKSPFSEFNRDFLRRPETLPPSFARIAFRDVTRATDSRTIRAALVPPNVFITNQAPYLLWPRGDEKDQAFLLGLLSSLPLDWYARRFVETHLNFFVLNPLPVPRPPRESKLWQCVVALAGRLAAVDNRFADWAGAVCVDCGPLEPNTKRDHIHELDAVVAHLYGLTDPQLVHIFETFHEGWDYNDRLKATLKHFHAWKKRLP
jgi:hypothetical protein